VVVVVVVVVVNQEVSAHSCGFLSRMRMHSLVANFAAVWLAAPAIGQAVPVAK